MLETYHELCTLNAVVSVTDEIFLEFVEKMTAITAQLPKVLVDGVPTSIVPGP